MKQVHVEVCRLAQHAAEQQQEELGLHHVVSWVASFIHSVLVNKKWSCESLSSAVCGSAAAADCEGPESRTLRLQQLEVMCCCSRCVTHLTRITKVFV